MSKALKTMPVKAAIKMATWWTRRPADVRTGHPVNADVQDTGLHWRWTCLGRGRLLNADAARTWAPSGCRRYSDLDTPWTRTRLGRGHAQRTWVPGGRGRGADVNAERARTERDAVGEIVRTAPSPLWYDVSPPLFPSRSALGALPLPLPCKVRILLDHHQWRW